MEIDFKTVNNRSLILNNFENVIRNHFKTILKVYKKCWWTEITFERFLKSEQKRLVNKVPPRDSPIRATATAGCSNRYTVSEAVSTMEPSTYLQDKDPHDPFVIVYAGTAKKHFEVT